MEKTRDRCRCGQPFTRTAPNGDPYWCLSCDAHMSACKRKGEPASKRCGCIT